MRTVSIPAQKSPTHGNKELWDAGRKIEDAALPELNKYFKTNFKRNENDIFDILDFKDEEESKLILRAISDCNIPKFINEDIDLFQGIISDLFPTTDK